MDACLLALAVWLAWPTQGCLTDGAEGPAHEQHAHAGRARRRLELRFRRPGAGLASRTSDPEERARLDAALERSMAQARAGQLIDGDTVIKKLLARECNSFSPDPPG